MIFRHSVDVDKVRYYNNYNTISSVIVHY